MADGVGGSAHRRTTRTKAYMKLTAPPERLYNEMYNDPITNQVYFVLVPVGLVRESLIAPVNASSL